MEVSQPASIYLNCQDLWPLAVSMSRRRDAIAELQDWGMDALRGDLERKCLALKCNVPEEIIRDPYMDWVTLYQREFSQAIVEMSWRDAPKGFEPCAFGAPSVYVERDMMRAGYTVAIGLEVVYERGRGA